MWLEFPWILIKTLTQESLLHQLVKYSEQLRHQCKNPTTLPCRDIMLGLQTDKSVHEGKAFFEKSISSPFSVPDNRRFLVDILEYVNIIFLATITCFRAQQLP